MVDDGSSMAADGAARRRIRRTLGDVAAFELNISPFQSADDGRRLRSGYGSEVNAA
jgi:hypothetical protein